MPVHTKASALVLNWKDTERTLRCVQSLLDSPLLERVLVVDNESRAGSGLRRRLQELNSSRISLLPVNVNLGFAGGVNRGLTKLIDAGFDQILVINNDATIDPDSVHKMVATQISEGPLTLVGPRITYPSGDVQAAGSHIHWLTAKVDHQSWPGKTDYLTWACVLVTKEIVNAIGLLNEQFFMYWEDAEYSLRLTSAGGKLLVEPEAQAIHEESATKNVIGNLTVRYATASLASFARIYPKSEFGARLRLLMRVIRQSLRHGLNEGRYTLDAWKWGRERNAAPAWQRIEEARWAK